MPPDTRWLTYAEAARLLGISEESIKRRVIRRGWARRPGNDGRVRIAVPIDVLPDPDADPDKGPDGSGDASGHASPDSLISALEREAALLREALGRERELAGQNADLRERLARTEGEMAALHQRAERDAIRTAEVERRAAVAEAGLNAFKSMPWWRRALFRP
jgi:hypothetical protein